MSPFDGRYLCRVVEKPLFPCLFLICHDCFRHLMPHRGSHVVQQTVQPTLHLQEMKSQDTFTSTITPALTWFLLLLPSQNFQRMLLPLATERELGHLPSALVHMGLAPSQLLAAVDYKHLGSIKKRPYSSSSILLVEREWNRKVGKVLFGQKATEEALPFNNHNWTKGGRFQKAHCTSASKLAHCLQKYNWSPGQVYCV